MLALKLAEGQHVENGRVDLNFSQAESWADVPHPGTTGGKNCIVLFGDSSAGPLVFLTSFPPMTRKMEVGPAHWHDTDNWRISIRGQTNMGRASYGPGDFRFQNGGRPYAGDNLAWGPEGGFGVIMMGDRRGFPVRPVNQTYVKPIEDLFRRLSEYIGVEVVAPYPAGPAIRTEIGTTDKAGKLEGSFSESETWPCVFEGTRMMLSILGERVVGPVVVLIRAEPGVTAIPACSFNTELMHVVVDGSARFGDEALSVGCVRLHESQANVGPVVAGPSGLSHLMVIGDRRAVGTCQTENEPAATQWATSLRSAVNKLTSDLSPSPGVRTRRAPANPERTTN